MRSHSDSRSVFICVNLWFSFFNSKFKIQNSKLLFHTSLFLFLFISIASFADEPSLKNQQEALEHYKTAVELHYKGDIVSAIEEYKNAILLDPNVAVYHADLGEAYWETYRLLGIHHRDAIEELLTAIRLEPNNETIANAYTTLGVIYDYDNLLIKAIEYHRKAIKINPHNFYAMNNLGQVYDQLGLVEAAIDNYKKAIEIAPDFAPAYDNLGTTYLKKGNIDEGIAMIKKAIDLSDRDDSHLGLYYNDLGAAYMINDDLQQARQCFQKALEILPDNPDIKKNLDFLENRMKGG